MNPSTQPPAGQPPAPDNTPLKTDIVQNIPMQTQQSSQPPVEKDDLELDLMMQDVGQELKKNLKRPAKHHFFSKKPKQPPIAQSITSHRPPQASQAPLATMSTPQPKIESQHHLKPEPKAPAKPKTKHSVPIFIILVTIIITGALVIVAIAASKQK